MLQVRRRLGSVPDKPVPRPPEEEQVVAMRVCQDAHAGTLRSTPGFAGGTEFCFSRSHFSAGNFLKNGWLRSYKLGPKPGNGSLSSGCEGAEDLTVKPCNYHAKGQRSGSTWRSQAGVVRGKSKTGTIRENDRLLAADLKRPLHGSANVKGTHIDLSWPKRSFPNLSL